MGFIRSFEISSSGLYVQRKRMDIIASNLANMETTRTDKGTPYRRKMIVLGAEPMEDFNTLFHLRLQAAKMEEVVEDQSPFVRVHDPGHPDADEEGYVLKPNVELVVEMTNMLMARRVFEANVTAMKTTRQMALKALEIGR
jgi:flagellar basal-body rod protein FlgC